MSIRTRGSRVRNSCGGHDSRWHSSLLSKRENGGGFALFSYRRALKSCNTWTYTDDAWENIRQNRKKSSGKDKMNVIHGQSKISLFLAILVGVTRYYKLATRRPSAFVRNKTSGRDFDSLMTLNIIMHVRELFTYKYQYIEVAIHCIISHSAQDSRCCEDFVPRRFGLRSHKLMRCKIHKYIFKFRNTKQAKKSRVWKTTYLSANITIECPVKV